MLVAVVLGVAGLFFWWPLILFAILLAVLAMLVQPQTPQPPQS